MSCLDISSSISPTLLALLSHTLFGRVVTSLRILIPAIVCLVSGIILAVLAIFHLAGNIPRNHVDILVGRVAILSILTLTCI